MPVDHYENFPVASWLLPRRLRAPIEALYAFARSADDLADEGTASDAERLAALDAYRRALDAIERGETPARPPFFKLAAAIRAHGLPMALLRDLLDAFSQDVVKKRYATFAELRDYSRRSADPVGRLVLHLFDGGSGRYSRERSDAVCSGLQLVNFWQDVAIDWAKGRVYIPQEDLERFGVAEAQIATQHVDRRWTALMRFQCERAAAMLEEGLPLARALPGRMGLEIRTTIHGGLRIADRISAASGDVFRHRPRLGPLDWVRIVAKSVAS